jgi:hypothetical protein
MKPKFHLLIGLFFSVLIYFVFKLEIPEALVLFFSSWFFIDLDHYFRYIIRKRDFCFIKFLRSSKESCEMWNEIKKEDKKLYKKPIFVFHGVEFLILILLLSFFWNIFLWVFIGFLIHLISDLFYLLIIREDPLHKISPILTHIKNKKLKEF